MTFYGAIGSTWINERRYNTLNKQFRVLWHQTLNRIVRYIHVPRKTNNFDVYPLFKRKSFSNTALEGNVSTIHPRFIDDTVVEEIWLADDISIESGFFYELFRFFQVPINDGDSLVWFPKDKTDKAFTILPEKVTVGDEEVFDLNPIHGKFKNNFRFIVTEVKFIFRIIKEIDIPEATTLIEGN